MSLAVLADHMASKGRGPDSMLIHMSPREVQGLQALAMKHGGSLTINPETGLPEAGFLDKLLPAIIGFAITAATGIPAWKVGLGVGAVETARTGDLGKGISAGLGAYGGAGIGAGMSTAGAEALSGNATALAAQQAGDLAGERATQLGLSDLAKGQMIDEAGSATARVATDASPFAKMSAGFDAVKDNPMSFANKENFKYLAAAAAPILADQAVKSNMPVTTTKPPMIAPYASFGGQFVAGNPFQATPTRGAEGGLMGMDNGGYSPGQLDFTQRSEPVVRMAEGGIAGYAGGGDVVRMAAGTPPKMFSAEELFQQTGSWEAAAAARDAQNNALNQYNWAQQAAPNAGSLVNNAQIVDYFKGLDQAQVKSGALDAKIAADMQTFNVSAADIGRATGTQANQGDFEKRFVNAITTPGITADQFNAYTTDVGLTGQNLATALKNSGQSQSAQYALTHNLNDAAGIVGAPQSAQDLYNTFGYKAGDLKGDTGGLAGLYTNINQVAGSLQDQINAGKISVADAQRLSQGEMTRLGISGGDIKSATGFDLANLFKDKPVTKVGDVVCGPGYKKSIDGKTCVPDTTVVTQETQCPTGFHYDPVLKQCVKNLSATQTTTTNVTTPTDIATAASTALPVGVQLH